MAKRLTLTIILNLLLVFGLQAQESIRGAGGQRSLDGKDQFHEDHEGHEDHDDDEDSLKVSIAPYYFKQFQDNLDTFHVAIDTALHGTHIYNAMDRQSISNTTLGNYGSPFQSNIYFDRPEVDFLFSDVYDAYYTSYKTLPNVNSRTPFTIFSYGNGGPKLYAEESLSGIFTQNVNKDINVGLYFDLIYARGRYSNQATRHKNYSFFSSYNKEKYNAYFSIGTSKLENYENGGFGTSDSSDVSYVVDPPSGIAGQPENYPVRIGSDARSFVKSQYITFDHKYNIGVLREVPVEDTVLTEFVPALNLVHQFKFEVDIKQYEDNIAVSSFYDTAYIHSSSSMDSARSRRISNRVGLYLDERINRFGKFGAGAYIQMDNNYITNTPWTSIEDSLLKKGYSGRNDYVSEGESFITEANAQIKIANALIAEERDLTAEEQAYVDQAATYSAPISTYNNTINAIESIVLDSVRDNFINSYNGYSYTNVIFGGSIFKRQGTHFFFDALGKVCLSGYNSGDWQLKGDMRQAFPGMGNWDLSVRANFQRKTPDYFLQHYYSNNFWWDNNFDASYTQQLGGTLSIPTINFKLSLDIDNMQNRVYFDENALPAQFTNNLAVLAVRLEKDFEIGRHLVWENDAVYQTTSSDEVMPLPQFTFYSNLYFRHTLAKVLHFEMGVDCRYYTEYNAPGYMPATGRFYNQRDVAIGNYPIMNVYADFFLRRMRFFVMGQHINMGWPSNNYFSAPNYAYNHRMFKFGLQWTFYD